MSEIERIDVPEEYSVNTQQFYSAKKDKVFMKGFNQAIEDIRESMGLRDKRNDHLKPKDPSDTVGNIYKYR